MSLLIDILKALGIFLVAWLILWIVSYVFISIPTDPTVWIGTVLGNIAAFLAALVAIWWFVRNSTSWK